MAELLLSTGNKQSILPESYVRPERDRPRLNEIESDRNIPIIDLRQQIAHAEIKDRVFMANCLMLSNRVDLQMDTPFKCKTSGRIFPTFQALGGHRASHKRPRLCDDGSPMPLTYIPSSLIGQPSIEYQILKDRISKLKNGYCHMKGTELEEEVAYIEYWIRRLRDKGEMLALAHRFSSILRFFTVIQPRTPSDHGFDGPDCIGNHKDHIVVNVHHDLRGARILRFSAGEASSSRTTDTRMPGDGSIGEGNQRADHGSIGDSTTQLPVENQRPDDGSIGDSTTQPPVETRIDVQGDGPVAGSSRGSIARTDMFHGSVSDSMHMGLQSCGTMHDQKVKMKDFREFANWAITLFITILVGLLSANKRQSELLFKSCSSLVFGATLLSLVMWVTISTGPSSQRTLTSLKIMQCLILGLLVIAAILVFMLLWSN